MADPIPERYKAHKERDPFPKIPAALLNSADIEAYAEKVVLLDPFDPARRKSASYEIPFLGTVFVWSPQSKLKEVSEITREGQTFFIQPNSIAYIYLATTFYLPDYIAVRFNLKITQVHRGLLLGTGPLVDPGFYGRLLVPLHNLTANQYPLVGGDGLIWVEFTKVSPNSKWISDESTGTEGTGGYKEFPDRKRNLTPEAYFEKANRGNPIISSIPDATLEAKRLAESSREASEKSKSSAEDAQRRVEDLSSRTNKIAWGLAAGLALTLTALIYAGYQLVTNVNATVQASVNFIKSQSADLGKHTDQMGADLGRRIDQLERAVDQERRAREQQTKKPQRVKSDR